MSSSTLYVPFNSSQKNMTALSPYDSSGQNVTSSHISLEVSDLEQLNDDELIEQTRRMLEDLAVQKQEETQKIYLRDHIRRLLSTVPRTCVVPVLLDDAALECMNKEELYAYSRLLMRLDEECVEEKEESEEEDVRICLADHRKNVTDQRITTDVQEDLPRTNNEFNAAIRESPYTLNDGRPIMALVAGRYKKVADRVKPVPTTYPEKFKTVRRIPSDPLIGMPVLPKKPPDFVPTEKFTMVRKDEMKLNPEGFMWPEEEKLVIWIIRAHEGVFAWDASERGMFRKDYFAPIVIPVVEHVPWAEKNIPIPPGLYHEIVDIVKEKVQVGTYEPSISSYRSKWFCVTKKDGKSLRIVHDLQPLNAVTIQDSGQIPFTDLHTEVMGGRGCYAAFDLFVAYDQRELAEESRDLTTFQTPLGTFRLTGLPMGYTNAVPILQGDMCFILQEEIPDPANPFMDDCSVIGPRTRYETDQMGYYLPSPTGFIADRIRAAHIELGPDKVYYEVVPENRGIRRFVWEHFLNVNRILQRIRKCGGTFSAMKSELCVPSLISVGRTLVYEGRAPEKVKVKKIMNWPLCKTVTDVRGFLGVCGIVRIWVKDFSKKAKPLIQLTKKAVEFEWGPAQEESMAILKEAVRTAPCLRPIDYKSDLSVILAVDSSNIGVGWVLLQLGKDRKRYPARFGSITWNEREGRYSQPKIEVYGLWRTLRAMRLHIIGVKKLVVEV
ncbi:MAG TPA: reverse transcriptase family protein, partial [Chlamydiales bacterium]|nr:reverse transcriptase family protein [Chlamydiales bacterium]